jgi:hypothetical protein
VTSPFSRTPAPAPAQGSPFGQQAAAPAQATATTPTQTLNPSGGRFAVKRERPDSFPKAQDLMPSEAKGSDGALVIIRVDRVTRGLKSTTGGTYDRFESKTWILDAPRGLPQHILEAGNEVDGAWYLPEMGWSGAGLDRDLEGPAAERQLFVGRVGSYKNNFGKLSPEFNMATDAELARAEAYVNAHPEVDYPKTTFARAS